MKESYNKSETAAILRQKAEDRLRKKNEELALQLQIKSLDTETLKLIHELEVHQIELEMQNEELVQTKLQAQSAADKYSELYDFAPSGYYTLSKGGEIIELNLLGAQFLEKNRDYLKNRRFGLFVSRDSLATFNLFFEKLFQSKKNESCDLVLLRDDDTPINVHLSGIIRSDGSQCLVSATDITEKMHSEKAVHDSDEKYRLLADHMTDIVWLMDMDFRVTFQSPSSEKLRGFTLEEMKEVPMEKNLAPESLKVALESFQREMQKVATHDDYSPLNTLELEYYCKDGTTVWLENKFSLIRNAEGKPVAILGEGRDIGARRRMEKALKNSESHSRAIIAAIPDMMFMVNSEGVYIDYKAAAEDLAYQTQSIIGLKNRDIMPTEFSDLIDEKIRLCIQTRQMQQFEYQLPLPEKGIRDFEARMVPNGPDEVVAIVRDVTERKKAEAEIILKNEELIRANAEKDKFFSIIAHDLRSPFNVFLGFTHLLADELDTFSLKELQKIAVSMRNSATNLFALLENLLEWSRMKRGLIPFKPVTLLLKDVIAENIKPSQDPADNKGIHIEHKIPEDLEIIADKYMLGSTIRNLISNAVKFTPVGGKITICAKLLSNHKVEISIHDTGIGIDKNMISNLFRLDENTNRKGTEGEPSTGLGLIICKEFIEIHGGKLWVESEEGKGSAFYFTLSE